MAHESKKTSLVESNDDSIHTIEYNGDVAFNHHDNKGYIKYTLHVLFITKNLVSVGQIVEQGIEVRFNHGGQG